jgi:hypothetical protein
MRFYFLVTLALSSLASSAQVERDTVLSRCPVAITDTVSSNNFFIEARPCTLHVYRSQGDLTIVIEQKEQFFTLDFREKRLRNTKYKITKNPSGKSELRVKYSFRSGDQVSYVDVINGTVETTYDKVTKIWKLKVTGMIANMVERTITYYKVKADFTVKG